MSIADRFRRFTGRRPGAELVRVEPQPTPPPARPLALPAPPGWPVCRRCGLRHEPRPIPRRGGNGLAGLYSRQVLPDPNRPAPLGQSPDADSSSLIRDRHHPWR